MAKVQSEIVSGIGANAKRTDLGNVAKIQRQAKIQRASGGAYGERTALTQLAQGAPTSTPEAPMPTAANPQLQNLKSATTQVVPVNELKGAPGEVITDGAIGQFESDVENWVTNCSQCDPFEVVDCKSSCTPVVPPVPAP